MSKNLNSLPELRINKLWRCYGFTIRTYGSFIRSTTKHVQDKLRGKRAHNLSYPERRNTTDECLQVMVTTQIGSMQCYSFVTAALNEVRTAARLTNSTHLIPYPLIISVISETAPPYPTEHMDQEFEPPWGHKYLFHISVFSCSDIPR